jgi:hypothetical protein
MQRGVLYVLVFLLVVSAMGHSQTMVGPLLSDARMHIWQAGGSYYSSGLVGLNVALTVGRWGGNPHPYRVFFQWNLPNSLIPDGSVITQARLQFTASPQSGSPQYNGNVFKVNYDITGSTPYGTLYAEADDYGNFLSQLAATSGTVDITFSQGPFLRAIEAGLLNDRITLAFNATSELLWAYYWWVDTRNMQLTIWYIPPGTVTADQVFETNTRVEGSSIGHWEQSRFVDYPVPHTFAFNLDSTETLRADSNLWPNPLTSNLEKYRTWNGLSDVVNHKDFLIQIGFTRAESQFKAAFDATVQAELLDNNSIGASIDFKDPWLIDTADSKGPKNRGTAARWWNRASPFEITTSNSWYKGVFLNQNPNWLPDRPNYSVGAPSPNTIRIKNQDYQAYFQNWEGTNVQYQNAALAQTGVVFTNTNATATAKYKLHLASNSAAAIENNTQRKIVRDFSGQLHMVYQSAGLIFYTHKYNGQPTWQPEKLVSPMLEGYPEYIRFRDPSIIYVPRVAAGDGGEGGDGEEPDAQEHRIRIAYEIYATDESEHGIYVCELDLDGNITYGPEQAGALWEGEGNHARPVLGVVPDYVSPYHPPGAYFTLLAWYQAEGNALRCSAWLYNNQFYFTTDLVTGVSEFSLAPYSMEANTWHLAFIQENNVRYMPVVWRGSYLERGDVETVAEGDESVYYHNPCIASVNASVYDNRIAITWQAYYWEFVTGGVKYSERLSRQEGWTSPTVWMPYATTTFQKPTITGSARYNLTAVYQDALLAWQNETTGMYWTRGRAGTGWEKVTSVGAGGDPTLSAAFNNSSTTETLLSRGGSGPYTMQYQGLEATDNPLSATEGRSGRILLRNGMVHIAVLDAELDRANLRFVSLSDTARIPLSRFEDVFATEAFAGTGLLKVRTLFAAKGEVQGGITMRVTLRDAATGQMVQTLRTFHVGEDTVLSFEASLNYGSRQLRLVLQPVGIAQARRMDVERWFVVKETTPLGKQSASTTATNELPKDFAVHPNYPNPFNPATTIKYDLPEPSHVSLVIYDVLGRKVVELENGVKDAGYHNVQWSTDNGQLSSGVYFARFVATDASGSVKLSKVSKLVLTK